jgi:hypothetical protein
LLQHRFIDVAADEPPKEKNELHGTREEQAEMAAYRLEDGTLVQPSEHILQAMVKAAGEFQIRGRGKKSYRDIVAGNILIEPAYIPHKSNDYLIDCRPVRVQRARIMRARPHIPEWELSFQINLIDDVIPLEVLNSILVKAGNTVGIGDYRPRYGRFIVTKFEG